MQLPCRRPKSMERAWPHRIHMPPAIKPAAGRAVATKNDFPRRSVCHLFTPSPSARCHLGKVKMLSNDSRPVVAPAIEHD